jgi:hypothetical protein
MSPMRSAIADDSGYVELFDLVGAEEEGPGGVLPDDGPPCGQTIVFRGHYGGSGTSSGTWSTGDAVAEAPSLEQAGWPYHSPIAWEKYRPHLQEEIDAAGIAKDCVKLEELSRTWPTFPTRTSC